MNTNESPDDAADLLAAELVATRKELAEARRSEVTLRAALQQASTLLCAYGCSGHLHTSACNSARAALAGEL